MSHYRCSFQTKVATVRVKQSLPLIQYLITVRLEAPGYLSKVTDTVNKPKTWLLRGWLLELEEGRGFESDCIHLSLKGTSVMTQTLYSVPHYSSRPPVT